MVNRFLALLGKFFLRCIRLAQPDEAPDLEQLSQEILSEWLGGEGFSR
ncbi:MAG: hypothetical protein PHD67_01365 [Oscillospiraceae bacterium]|nr:hypothetical protein [Oscillospiraceae bacterium]